MLTLLYKTEKLWINKKPAQLQTDLMVMTVFTAVEVPLYCLYNDCCVMFYRPSSPASPVIPSCKCWSYQAAA